MRIFISRCRYRATHFNNFGKLLLFRQHRSLVLKGFFAVLLEPLLYRFIKKLLIYTDNEFPHRKETRIRWNNLIEINDKKIDENVQFVCVHPNSNLKHFQFLPIPTHDNEYIGEDVVFVGNVSSIKSLVTIDFLKKIKKSDTPIVTILNDNYINTFRKYGVSEEMYDYVYTDLSNLIRLIYIKNIKKNFSKFFAYGSTLKKFGIDSYEDCYSQKAIKNLYKNSICVDFGSNSAGNSLYERSIRIIESGGLLIQVRRYDSVTCYGEELAQEMCFDNINELNSMIRNLQDHSTYRNALRNKQRTHFLHQYRNAE